MKQTTGGHGAESTVTHSEHYRRRCGVLVANFIGKLELMNGMWREMRKLYVKPVKKGSWEPMSELALNIMIKYYTFLYTREQTASTVN